MDLESGVSICKLLQYFIMQSIGMDRQYCIEQGTINIFTLLG